MTADITTDASRIGALADPTREALYACVSAQDDAIGRDDAASAIGVPAHVAKFHLDKLVDAGLLDVEFRRLSGRSGPGAGRPSKLYRRASGTVSVSLPPRRYDLAGHLLARAIERSGTGLPLDEAIEQVAREEGDRVGAAGAADHDAPELDRLGGVLAVHGYEPRIADERMLLANCPFDTLAREHTGLVCSMNHAYVKGVAEGLGCAHLQADLDPGENRCCVTVRRSDTAQER
ncbi:metalloregulator ArsR/SmtB family transcription factor [Microbacterium sp. SD291]|uniref:helix-turn-helix transcriptional regulator n=1 Tax=Microbacterium sp. SD291 TaxID=2782007 RepID=UPI001A96EA52|nr:helix-turn-helix domain-containing protein [Microbacterium sp. SD291]MBO0981260.1 transcriptional regulator [Microbacterium sp. SD291]